MSPATRRASPFERVDFPEHVDGFHGPFGRNTGQCGVNPNTSQFGPPSTVVGQSGQRADGHSRVVCELISDMPTR